MQKRYFSYGGVAILAVFVGFVLGMLWNNPAQTERSPYVAQLDSSVRGLSSQEVDDLLNGRGAGYARMAELNSYPGPRHVLDCNYSPNSTPRYASRFALRQAQDELRAPQGATHRILSRPKAVSKDAVSSYID
ncbi:MAG: hypothetical protein DPW09_18650 [Anaerolineae bacterium]|nr:hypothetical protein [Anaerolineae bacterium]